ncbi:MAG: sodium:calcium antiporter [Candidatus Magnetominusculus sp. LBB02]|nr:sodium:calcium antiporter [Candidatus Magnetominusculus sp. LBB02]
MGNSVVTVFAMLTVGIALLVFGADKFTYCAERIGKTLKLPGFVIGAVIISIGTCLPELIASIFAVLKGSTTIVAGSVVGSNVTNTFLVLGIAFLFFKGEHIKVELINIDIPFFLTATALFSFMTYRGQYRAMDGILSLIGVSIYIWSVFSRKPRSEDEAVPEDGGAGEGEVVPATPFTYILLVISSVMLYFGGEWTVDNINEIAKIYHLNEGVIAGTAVAVASSLPELMIAIKFARRGKLDIALGNVVGSGIINFFLVIGVASLFSYFTPNPGVLLVAEDTINKGLPVMLFGSIIFTFVVIDKKPSKYEGAMFLLIYVFYVGRMLKWL